MNTSMEKLNQGLHLIVDAFTSTGEDAVNAAEPKPKKGRGKTTKPDAAPVETAKENPVEETQKHTGSTANLTYEDIAKAITSTAKKDREKVIQILADFGAKKGPDLKEDQYVDFMNALNKATCPVGE